MRTQRLHEYGRDSTNFSRLDMRYMCHLFRQESSKEKLKLSVIGTDKQLTFLDRSRLRLPETNILWYPWTILQNGLLISIPNQKVSTVTEALLKNVIARHGISQDQGRNLESEVWK